MSTKPEDVGLSSERLARIDRHLQERYIQPGKIAGAVTLVARHGQVAHLSALGLRDRERKEPMTEDTVFRIYSMTKPIVSIAMMSLVEEARCALMDPVHRYIPEWEHLRVFRYGVWPTFVTDPPQRPMTIRDLLTHTSGLTYGFMLRDAVDAAYRQIGVSGAAPGDPRPATLQEMVDKLAKLPLIFSPGTRWNYSVATDIAGYLVERISGQRLDEFLRARIFEPLGMRDTGFHLAETDAKRFAANYRLGPDRALVVADDPLKSEYLRSPTFLSGGGGLVSTAEDYRRFCQMLLDGGRANGHQIVGRKTIELMTQNHLPDNTDLAALATGTFSESTFDGVGFGLGFAVLIDAAKRGLHGSEGEYYWGGAASTAFWVDPSEDLLVVFLAQLMPSNTYDFRGQLRNLVYSSIVD